MNTPTAVTQNPKRQRLLRLGIVVSGVTSAIALAVMLFKPIEMTRNGQGLETYRTFWLVEGNWVGFVVFAGCLVVALLVGFALRWNERGQWRGLEKKFGDAPVPPNPSFERTPDGAA